MFRADRLAELMSDQELSQSELARRAEVSQTVIFKLLDGQSQGSKFIHRIAAALGTTPAYLMDESELVAAPGVHEAHLDARRRELEAAGQTRLRSRQDAYRGPPREDSGEVEIIGIDLRYGLGGAFLDNPVEETVMRFPLAWIRQVTDAPPERLRWTAGVGNSMEPTIGDGWPLLVDLGQRSLDMADLVWVLAYGEVGMIKRLRPHPDGSVEVISDNPSVPSFRAADGELHLIGRVLCTVKRF